MIDDFFIIFVLFCFANILFLIFSLSNTIVERNLSNTTVELSFPITIADICIPSKGTSFAEEQKVNFLFPHKSNKNIYEQEKIAGN